MNAVVIVPAMILENTLSELSAAGRNKSERVALWLGARRGGNIQIETLWVPEQQAGYDFFDIPPRAMKALFGELRDRRLMVAAQIHTHPREAFHSYADDKWAIVRHVGALSLVIPYFAQRTGAATFVRDAAVFVLSPKNQWIEAAPTEVAKFYQICK